MSGNAILIYHMGETPEDRMAALLADRGWRLRPACPARGDQLPAPEADDLVVAYGGAQSANDADRLGYLAAEIDWIRDWITAGGAFTGFCLGAQLLARALGARVGPDPDGRVEIGYTEIHPLPPAGPLLAAPAPFYQWHVEGFEVPCGATALATAAVFENQAFRFGDRAFGFQFHPEVTASMIESWLAEAGDMLALPGAHDAPRHHADHVRHGPAMSAWLADFVDHRFAAPRSPVDA